MHQWKGAEEERKHEFYEELRVLCEKILKRDTLLIFSF